MTKKALRFLFLKCQFGRENKKNMLENPLFIFLTLLWTIPWKGVALWKAAKNGHKKWFIALLILNTFAILEIIYIFYFSGEDEKNKILIKLSSLFSKPKRND